MKTIPLRVAHKPHIWWYPPPAPPGVSHFLVEMVGVHLGEGASVIIQGNAAH